MGQSLDQLGKQHLLSDIYGSLAQLTQSNMSTTQATQNMGRAFSTLSNPSAKMRDELGQLGLNAVDIQQHLGERGLAGTAQILDRAIREHMNPAGQVIIDTFRKSEQATGAAKTIFDALPPAAQAAAQAIQNNTMSFAEFRKTRGGLSVEQANDVEQWLKLQKQITGYSSALTSGQGVIQTYLQTMGLLTGNQETARVALLLSGSATDDVNGKIKKIDDDPRARRNGQGVQRNPVHFECEDGRCQGGVRGCGDRDRDRLYPVHDHCRQHRQGRWRRDG